jgi:type IV pilus assembly protein PilZ
MTDKAKHAAKHAGKEKRRHARAPLRARVDFELVSEETFLFEYASNVSRGGIFLATRNPLPVGTRLVLRFALPDELATRTIRVAGQVIWVNPYVEGGQNLNPGMGVEFLDLSHEDQEAISRIVRRIAVLTDE